MKSAKKTRIKILTFPERDIEMKSKKKPLG